MARTCKTVRTAGGGSRRVCKGSFPKGKVRTAGSKPSGRTPTPKGTPTKRQPKPPRL